MKIPITGTVKAVDPHISGDPDDPIRIIDIDLGRVRWNLVKLDLENEEMEIEVTPMPLISIETGELDGEGRPLHQTRQATPAENAQALEHANSLSLERMSKQALYGLSGSPRLNNKFKKIIE